MSTDNLFIEPITFEKVSSDTQLGDPTSWDHEITKAIYDKIPFIAKYNTMIQFEKRDDKTGYAYGQIIVNNQLNIPIIIYPKKGVSMLAPFDVFNSNDTWYPLTAKRVDEMLYDGQAFDRVARPDEKIQDQQQATQPMNNSVSGGREIIASYGTVLDAVLPLSMKADVVGFLDKIAKNRNYEASYRKNGNFDKIRKIASQYKGSFVEDKGNKDLPVNIISIEKLANSYGVEYISDEVYDPTYSEMSPLEIKKTFGPAILKTASENDGIVLSLPNRINSDMFLYEDIGNDIDELTSCGDCSIKTAAGQEEEGYLFSNVVDFDMNLIDYKVFSNGEKYAMSRVMCGSKGLVKEAGFESDVIEDGVIGCFMCSDDPSNPIVTTPFKASSIMRKEASGLATMVRTVSGRDIELIYTPLIESIMEKSANSYYIPAKMKFIRLGTERITPNASVLELRKVAKWQRGSSKEATVKYTGINYEINGVDRDVPLKGLDNLSKHAAKTSLVVLGATPGVANRIIKLAKEKHSVKIGSLRNVTSKYPLPALDDMRLAQSIRRDTVKLAAELPQSETVDSMLALNFVTPENIQVFASYIPTLKDSASHLAALLVAVRLGLKEVDEYAVKQSMTTLDEVITKLEDMFAVQNTLQGMNQEQ